MRVISWHFILDKNSKVRKFITERYLPQDKQRDSCKGVYFSIHIGNTYFLLALHFITF